MATYKANHVGFAKQMNTHEIRDLVQREAERAASELRAWGEAHRRTGLYAQSIKVHVGKDHRVGDRPAAFIVADVPYAAALEVGSHNIRNPPSPMTKLLDQIRG